MKKEDLIDTENTIKELFKDKRIRTMFHLSGGNEEFLIEIFKNIKPDDWVFSTHRSHYHALLKGMTKEQLIKEVLDGYSMHLNDKSLNLFTSSIVCGVIPIATGVALAIKRLQTKEHVYVFLGDMASEMGIFHECSKYAANHDLPITFIIEDNGFGIMNTLEVWGKKKKPKIIRYKYKNIWPHCGTGDFVDFR